MAVSLRIVIGVTTAVIVLVVASVTLAITYTVSVGAVRNTGERLAEAITSTVALEVQNYVSRPEEHLFVYRNSSKIPNEFVLPPDDPGYATEAWGEKYSTIMRAQLLEVNYSYSSISIIFDDGSLVATLDHYDAPGWITEGVQTWRPPGYGTLRQRTWNGQTKQFWDDAVQGGPPPRAVNNASGAVSGYLSVKSLTGGREACIWFPPTVDNQNTPRYVLYGLCTLYNASNYNIGQVSIGRYMDTLPDFLQGTSKTENTQLMLVDNYGMLVGSTYAVDPVVFGQRGVLRMTGNCVSSTETTTDGREEVIGCRAFARDYPYAPLQAVVNEYPAFARTPSRIVEFGKLDGDNYYYISQRIPTGLSSYSINLLVFMPESDVLGDIVAGRNLAIGITVAVFLVGAVLSFILIGTLLAPIDDVAKRMYFTSKLTSEKELTDLAHAANDPNASEDFSMYEQKDHDEEEPLARSSLAEVRALQTAYSTMDTAIKSFTKYVPRDVVKELMSTNQMCEIQMRPMRCSMLFTDIASFTSICERVPPPVLSGLIRLYFERSSRVVMGHGGVIDKFIGDCIMAVWGAPVPIDSQEVRSSVCGHMLIWETQQDPLRSEFQKAGESLAIRVGVATGEVLAGNMGSQARMNYTVIGDDVNLASRLEALNKQWGTSTMVSEETAEEVADYLVLRYVISIAVVGKQQPVKVYEVMGVDPDANTAALGKVTSEASENVTLAQVQKDEDEIAMAERYGVAGSTREAGPPLLSAGKLLRRALRKHQLDPSEKVFAAVYGTAVGHWNRGEFGQCVAVLKTLAERTDVPTGCAERLSVQKVMAAAEENLREPPAGEWTGVWVATEK